MSLSLTSENINSNYFLYKQRASNYTPVWSASSGTQPVIGDGNIAGRYVISGNLCHTTIILLCGSTTTFGTADWRFTLPFKPRLITEFSVGNAIMQKSGGNYYTGMVDKVNLSATEEGVQILVNNSGAGVKSNVPFTWGSGDALNITITYEL